MLDNPKSSQVREVARLAKKDARSETGLFLLEGPQAVREALTFRPELFTELYLTDEASFKYPDLEATAAEHGIAFDFVTEPVIRAMADTVTPQGVVAVCRQFPVSVRKIFDRDTTLVAVLEEVRDPGNAGTILRAADAAGADAVIFTGRSVDLYHPKVVRSTTGSLFHLPVATSPSLAEVIGYARAAGMQIFAADVTGDDVLQRRAELSAPTVWVFGNEARGLTEQDLALVDSALRLPIYGSAESLNLATAASVCLYESAFAQRSS